MDYKTEMRELRDTLNAHGYRYYVLDATITSCCASRRSSPGALSM